MIKEMTSSFETDYLIPPGETILETIQSMGITQAELAKRMGRPVKTINEIVKGKAAITPETSLQLEKVLGIPSSFWNTLEKNYREGLAKEEERRELENSVDWLEKFPIKDMISKNFIERKATKVEQLKELFGFFGVASITSWDQIWDESVAFRKSESLESDKFCIAAYLRKAEILANDIECEEYNAQSFREIIAELRGYTTEEDPKKFVPEMIEKCKRAGVALVFLPDIGKTRLSGATKWLNTKKAMIVLSLRHKTNDHLWFTFFHEVGHILLHSKKEMFVESNKMDKENQDKEKEANEFAASLLIPQKDYQHFVENTMNFTHSNVADFAKQINIHPALVVGRLQREGRVPFSHLNRFKVSYTWEEELK